MLPHLRFLFSFAGKSYSLKIFSQSQKGAQLCIFFVYRFHSGSKFFHEQLLIQLHAPIFEAFFRFWIRCISFDGFVTYEGRRFGIPYSYGRHTCRVQRENFTLYIYDLELRKVLVTHDITWSRKDSFCRDQFVDEQPEEKPSVPVKISISQKMETPKKSAFAKFAFGGDRNE